MTLLRSAILLSGLLSLLIRAGAEITEIGDVMHEQHSITNHIRGGSVNQHQHQQQQQHNQIYRELQTKKLRECSPGDCTADTDCARGLQCTAVHIAAVTKVGLDPIKAYCDTNAGGPGQHVCYDPAKLSIKRCLRNVSPKPLDPCPLGRDNVPADRKCQAGPVICCRTLKRITEDGRRICNPRTCTYSRSCSCGQNKPWKCIFKDPRNCVTRCDN